MDCSESETVTFLNLYQQERILWDKNDPNYHDIHRRLCARERIAGALGLGIAEVGEIFNRLRCDFVKESRKMYENGDYVPVMEGFQTMTTLMKQLSTNTSMAEEDDPPCDVCKLPGDELTNQIIFCDKCNVCVHQTCYGVKEIPEGSWYCKPCALNIQPSCIFCLQSKGAMKSTSDCKWAHVSCALWVPEVSFADSEEMENIINVHKIPKSRWNLSCFICHKKGGACIQCYVPRCKTAYHVTCAYKNGLDMVMEDGETNESEVKFESFCRSHTEKRLKERASIDHPNKSPVTKKTKLVSNDEKFARSPSSKENIMSAPAAAFMTDVSNVEKSIIENETSLSHEVASKAFIGSTLVRKGTARKSFSATTQKIYKKKLSDILPKNVKTNKPRVRTKVPKENTAKHKANQSAPTEQIELTLLNKLPPYINEPGPSRKKPKLSKQRQFNKTSQNLHSPNSSSSSVSAIRKLFSTPKNQQTQTEIQSERGSTTENVQQTFNNHPLSGSWNQSPPNQRGNQIPTVPNYCSPSAETGLQEVPKNNQLKSFLGYFETLLQPLSLKKSLKLQGKLISYVLKEIDMSSSSDEISDVSSVSD